MFYFAVNNFPSFLRVNLMENSRCFEAREKWLRTLWFQFAHEIRDIWKWYCSSPTFIYIYIYVYPSIHIYLGVRLNYLNWRTSWGENWKNPRVPWNFFGMTADHSDVFSMNLFHQCKRQFCGFRGIYPLSRVNMLVQSLICSGILLV